MVFKSAKGCNVLTNIKSCFSMAQVSSSFFLRWAIQAPKHMAPRGPPPPPPIRKRRRDGGALTFPRDGLLPLFPPLLFLSYSLPPRVCLHSDSISGQCCQGDHIQEGEGNIFFRPDHDFAGSDYLCWHAATARDIFALFFVRAWGHLRLLDQETKKNEAF